MNTFFNFLFAAIKSGTPLMLATTGEIITEKSGSLNLGVEGLMAMGAIGSIIGASYTNNIFGALLFAFLFACIGGIIFAFLTVTLKANQNVTGLALTIFGVGFYKTIGQSLRASHKFPKLSKSFIASIAEGTVNDFGDVLFNHSIIIYIALVIVILCWIYLRFTKSGLKTCAIGENPGAADAVGIKVNRKKYFNIILGAGIAGLGGAYLALCTHRGIWNESWVNGEGWISIALVIFANWSPARAIFGSFVFGMFNSLFLYANQFATELPNVFGWMSTQILPVEFYRMLPFLVTLLVLFVSSIINQKKQTGPAALGINYYREDR